MLTRIDAIVDQYKIYIVCREATIIIFSHTR